MKKIIAVTALTAVTFTSCVSKKKYVAATTHLQEVQQKNDKLEAKLGAIETKVSNYYAKINSLASTNDSLSYNQVSIGDLTAMSEANKEAMRSTLQEVDPELVAGAKTFEDSINLAVAYNLERRINANGANEGVEVSVDGTVVMVNLSDQLLFRSGSSHVSSDAYPVLQKLAAVINSEPAMEVLVEGHTDDRTVVKDSYLIDNWDLSLRRSAAVVRILQNRYSVNPKKLIASGRSYYDPITQGSDAENRRTTITILPNLDKFLALLDSSASVASTTSSSNSTGEQTKQQSPEKIDNTINTDKKENIDG